MGLLDIPDYYVLACLLGLTGQAIRGCLGIVKLLRAGDVLSIKWTIFASTLILGALSGLLGGLIYDLGALTPASVPSDALWNDRNFLLMAISAGYFGADAIEGILGRHSPAKARK